MTHRQYNNISEFVADVRVSVVEKFPDGQGYFDIYANEALFGYSIIEPEISVLQPNSTVMEIGAGLLLLSGYLASRGLAVHALEPMTGGFSHFREMQDVVLEHYKKIGLILNLVDRPIEEFKGTEIFDYVYSINVFEHIVSVELGLSNAYLSLKHGGILRVYCPNYHFPYEPHFNIPTFFNKQFTGAVFRTAIASSKVQSPKETWDALNWINVSQVRGLFRKRFGCEPSFNRLATYHVFLRVLLDPQFTARRSKWMFTILNALHETGLLHLFRLFPAYLAPVMDFNIRRN